MNEKEQIGHNITRACIANSKLLCETHANNNYTVSQKNALLSILKITRPKINRVQ